MKINGKVHCFFEQEEWKDIKGFEGLYAISNYGRVKSLKRICRANTCGLRTIEEKILSPCVASSGYCIVVLSKNGAHKSCSIHRLVAEAFIENPENKKEVNHKDECKTNNIFTNLEWCDRAYNANYGTSVKRCSAKKFKKVAQIDINSGVVIRVFPSAKLAEEMTGISRKNISMVCLNKRKIAGGYIWKFAE